MTASSRTFSTAIGVIPSACRIGRLFLKIERIRSFLFSGGMRWTGCDVGALRIMASTSGR